MNMLYPKQKTKKRRRHHPESIIQKKNGRCLLCQIMDGDTGIKRGLQKHHIYDGPNRQVSEENGFYCYLCRRHHTDGRDAVHQNASNMRRLQKACQKIYERRHSRKEFMDLIGRSYLGDEEDI